MQASKKAALIIRSILPLQGARLTKSCASWPVTYHLLSTRPCGEISQDAACGEWHLRTPSRTSEEFRDRHRIIFRLGGTEFGLIVGRPPGLGPTGSKTILR